MISIVKLPNKKLPQHRENMAEKVLTIVILSYNTKDYLRRCLESLARGDRSRWIVTVADNASTDGSSEMVRREFPWVTLVQNAENLGFAAGNNVVLKEVQTPFVMLLNSDTELLPPYTVNPLLEWFEKDKTVAVVTPKLVLANGEIDWACHRGVPTPWNALTYFSHLEHLFRSIPRLSMFTGGYHQVWKAMDRPHDIDVCSGAAMIVRVSAAQKVGWLDERFQFYGEDVDWCFSFRQSGWRVVFDPSVSILHFKNVSGIKRERETAEHKAASERSLALFFATMGQFYEKHYLRKYPRWVGAAVKQGIRFIHLLERSHIWPSPRKYRRK